MKAALGASLLVLLAACGPDSRSADGTAAVQSAAAPVQAASEIEVVAADRAIPFGSPVEVSFTLTAGGLALPAAKAVVKVGPRTVSAVADRTGTGSVTLTPDQLVPGGQLVTVSYAGDATTSATSGSTTVTVEPAATAVQLTVTPTGAGTATAAIAVSTATGVESSGSVALTVDGAEIANTALTAGAATVDIPAGLSVGDHPVAATFTPTAKTELAGASATATFTITKTSATVTAVGHKDAIRYGDTGYFNVAVTPVGATGADLTGAVTVLDAGTPVAQGTTDGAGTASLEFFNTADPGPRTYTVSYAGSDTVEPAQADFTVQTTQTDVDFGIDTPSLKPGESGSILVSVIGTPAAPTGTAAVSVDGVEVARAALDAAGRLSAPVSSVTVGAHRIAVSYSGDTRFQGDTATATLTVKEPLSNPNADGAAAINADNPCPSSAAACVDLSRERAWLQSGGEVTYGPVSITSGRKNYRTPAGSYSAYWFDKDHKSSIFDDAPMPNSVFFNGGIAFHAGSLSVQSHGCIHLSNSASSTFFENLAVGDEVYVFGSAPY